jgi:sec-independent protein translocase protein TatA
MMPHNPIAIIILIVIVLLFFGANKLPEMAKSLGKSKNAFEEGLREGRTNDDDELKKEKEREAEIRRRVEAEMRQEGK